MRARIYGYALGGKTIIIGYETYRTVKEASSEVNKVDPIFRYCCAVYSQPALNPFKKQLPFVNKSHGLTLLNNICRQLYIETATLPYALNTLAFSSHNTVDASELEKIVQSHEGRTLNLLIWNSKSQATRGTSRVPF